MPSPIPYDAIVIGSGISGGWAVKELCEKGLKTLLIERGRKVEHIKDYPTANKAPWELPHRGNITAAFRKKIPTDGACMTITGKPEPLYSVYGINSKGC